MQYTLFFDTVNHLNDAPASITVTDPTTGKSYAAVMNGYNLLFQLLYETDAIPALPQLIYDAGQGRYNMIELILSPLLAQQEMTSIGMQFSVQCNEEIPFASLADLEEVLAQYPDLAWLFEYSVVGKFTFQVCEEWDSGRAAPIEDEPVRSDLPTLIMAGEYDPLTPPDWGRHTAETLKNSFGNCSGRCLLSTTKDPKLSTCPTTHSAGSEAHA